MKKYLLVIFIVLNSISSFGWEVNVPSDIFVDPSCSSPLYQGCSVELTGNYFYKFSIEDVSGTLSGSRSCGLSTSGCDTWKVHPSWFDGDWYTHSDPTSGTLKLTIDFYDTEDQIPGRYRKYKITVTARNTLNAPSYEATKVDYVYLRINEPTITPSATGPLCYGSTRTFTLSDYPTSGLSSIDWNLSSNLYEVSSTSTSVTVRPLSSTSTGVGWVQPKYNMTCSDVVVCDTKSEFIVGKIQNVVVTGTAGVCPNSLYIYTAQIPLGHSITYSYSWIYPTNWTLYSQWDNKIQLYTPSSPDYGTVRVSVTNACGTGTYSGITVYPGYCGGYYMVSPNPGSEYIVLDISENRRNDIELYNFNKIVLKMYDKMGTLVYSESVYELPYNINTSKLPSGNYLLYIITEPNDSEHKATRESIQIVIDK